MQDKILQNAPILLTFIKLPFVIKNFVLSIFEWLFYTGLHYSYSSLVHSLLPKDNLFKNIFDFTTAGDWDSVAAVECLPALH